MKTITASQTTIPEATLETEAKIKMTHAVYDGYDYEAFWKGRGYENAADKMALLRLLKKARVRVPAHLVDVGSGMGRLAGVYDGFAKEIVLFDPSLDQLKNARDRLGLSRKYEFVVGVAELMPFESNVFDVVISIRMFHYVTNPGIVLGEMARVLAPGGYLILEIPNKIHFKARIKSFLSGRDISSRQSVSRSVQNPEVVFLNHHPVVIRELLHEEGFEIIDILSASNFRSPSLKKIFPAGVFLFFEKLFQKPLAKIWFGPSVYFLARKKVGA